VVCEARCARQPSAGQEREEEALVALVVINVVSPQYRCSDFIKEARVSITDDDSAQPR